MFDERRRLGALRILRALPAREKATGIALNHVCTFIDSADQCAGYVIDSGERRKDLKPGMRVNIATEASRESSCREARLHGLALSALEYSPRTVALCASVFMATGDLEEAKEIALGGLEQFGVQSEGALLLLHAGLIARMEGSWQEAKRAYERGAQCGAAEIRLGIAACASLSAIEWDDQEAARSFKSQLFAHDRAKAEKVLENLIRTREARGEGELARNCYAELMTLETNRPSHFHEE